MAQDPRLTACFLKLNGLPEFEPFRKWLNDRREHFRDTLESSLDPQATLRAQGRSQQLREILEFLEQAPALASKERG